jgi:tRNA pseudouridine38-40 synthase
MPRYKLTIEYDGTLFYGWQRQDKVPTIQGTIEAAVKQFSGQTLTLEGAGRTDTGVHATGQVAHLNLTKEWPTYRIVDALNFYLRDTGIAILNAEMVPNEFHARFSAKMRVYHYRILNRRAPHVLEKNRSWHVIKPLNVRAMQEAARAFIGTHDFTSFRSVSCQAKSAIRTLDEFTLIQEGYAITAHIKSRSFLHNQVRIMMGSLHQVGMGEWCVGEIIQALEKRNRVYAGPTAPPWGLYLTEVQY